MSGGRRSGEGVVAPSAGGSRHRRGGRVSVGSALPRQEGDVPHCRPSLLPAEPDSTQDPWTPGGAAGEGRSQAPAPGVRRLRGSKNKHPTHRRGGWGSRKSKFISDPWMGSLLRCS